MLIRFLPNSATPTAKLILITRGMRSVADGCISVLLPACLLAFIGTLNPSAGNVSVFLPLEQTALSGAIADRDRTHLFARYSMAGSLLGCT